MHWPIRNQILVPFAAILMAAVTTIAVFSAVLAARRSAAQTVSQLQQVMETLAQANFPLAGNVLEQMRGLSGAHFVVCNERGDVLLTTLPNVDGSAVREAAAPFDRSVSGFAAFPAVTLDGTRYLAASVRRPPQSQASRLLVLYPEASWRQAQWDAALPPLTVGVVTIVLLIAASAWLAHRIGSRIRDVERQVALVAAGQFEEVRVGSRQDEIQELAASVNAMCRQLRRMQQTIRQSERARLLGQVAGGIAHQLRNALTGARMGVQIHARRCRAEGSDESLAVALRQLALAEGQVRAFLAVGRSEARPHTACDMAHLLREVAGLIGPACEHSHVEVALVLPDAPCMMQIDVDGVRTAVLNLALNAVEAAGAGGGVELMLTAGPIWMTVAVTDTGPGPRNDVAESLFEPFVSTKPEGVGLGLAVARQAAVEHGGDLTWTRVAGQTRFAFRLPCADPVVENTIPALSSPV